MGAKIIKPARGQDVRVREVEARVEKGLVRLFSNPWFERCWVLQEILLANHAVLWCGGQRMKWFNICGQLRGPR